MYSNKINFTLIFFLILLLINLFFTGCQKDFKAQHKNRISKSDTINISSINNFCGLWISEKYINSLLKTSSPYLSFVENIQILPMMCFWITNNNNNEYYIIESDLNETGESRIINILKIDNSKKYKITYEDNSLTQKFELLNSDSISWEFRYDNDHFSEIFIRVNKNNIIDGNFSESINEFVNNIVISGLYRDKEKNNFSFNKNGILTIASSTFSYNLGLSFLDDSCDFIYFNESNSFFPKGCLFKIFENKIYFFHNYHDENTFINSSFLVLFPNN